MEMKKIYENTYITIYEDNKGYDFHYNIKNNLYDLPFPSDIKILYGDDLENELEIKEWVGLFNNEDYIVDYILNGKYQIR